MTRIAMLITLVALALLIAPNCALTTVPLGHLGVRSSNFSGVLEADLAPGWHVDMPGIHRMTILPSSYQFLDYSADDSGSLLIRTRDNNNVMVDVTVPFRIKAGEGYQIMKEGNHAPTGDGFRFQRLAADTTVSVLREELAELTSADFYNTEKRLAIAEKALAMAADGISATDPRSPSGVPDPLLGLTVRRVDDEAFGLWVFRHHKARVERDLSWALGYWSGARAPEGTHSRGKCKACPFNAATLCEVAKAAPDGRYAVKRTEGRYGVLHVVQPASRPVR